MIKCVSLYIKIFTNNINMKNKVKISDLLILVYWVRAFQLVENKKFNYDFLMKKIEEMSDNGVDYFDTSKFSVDELMIDAYKVYTRLSNTKELIESAGEKYFFLNSTKDIMIEETSKYEKIIDKMLENVKYEDAEIRGIQKGYLKEKLKKCIEPPLEDYENAARLRDLINEC